MKLKPDDKIDLLLGLLAAALVVLALFAFFMLLDSLTDSQLPVLIIPHS